MNIRTIKDLMIDAVRLDRRTHEHVGPADLRAQQFAYAHDFVDMAGWGRVPGDKKCQLDRDDGDPFRTLRLDFWEQYDRDPTPEEISRAQQVHGWVMLVDEEKERRALIGWLRSKVGGRSFRRWCKHVEGISQTTGLKRKNRALEKIFLILRGSVMQNDPKGHFGGLPFAGDFGDFSATIAAGASEVEGIDNWSTADAKSPMEANVPIYEFTWSRKQNARRRQRAAAKAKKQAQT